MKRIALLLVLSCFSVNLFSQTETELNAWNDVNIFEINKLYPRTNVIPVGEEWSKNLNENWNFWWFEHPDQAPKDFLTMEPSDIVVDLPFNWELPMDRGVWQTTVHGVTKSWTRLKPLST